MWHGQRIERACYVQYNHWQIQGRRWHAPLLGSNSFVLVNVFAEKPLSEVGAPPRLGTPSTGNPGSATDNSYTVDAANEKQ